MFFLVCAPVPYSIVNKPAYQSSTAAIYGGHLAVDGRRSTSFRDAPCTSSEKEDRPWWIVDFLKPVNVRKVIIINRSDCCRE